MYSEERMKISNVSVQEKGAKQEKSHNIPEREGNA